MVAFFSTNFTSKLGPIWVGQICRVFAYVSVSLIWCHCWTLVETGERAGAKLRREFGASFAAEQKQ